MNGSIFMSGVCVCDVCVLKKEDGLYKFVCVCIWVAVCVCVSCVFVCMCLW